ncbi:Gfo/Idh/MocA family oxidoreductase [Caldilinea sp.]|uniref:Gfo/Idh/MocA family protein n=1 Tax=Caldilinea sp. TaxID=2293560 RepID=UPI002C467CAD|nr:Gfo/Idh/MocA family oxidoreductase [Caldilinea sp.]
MSSKNSVLPQSPLRIAIIGCGGMARHHTVAMLRHQELVQIPVVCEPSAETYARFAVLFKDVGLTPPPNEPNLTLLLREHADALDAVFIITPHVLHHEQAGACMEAGLDVLLEKPMVMNTVEARSLIEIRNRTRRRLVVAFNGSLSPQIRTAVTLLRSGELGAILNIHGVVWQSWNSHTQNTWRQAPEIAGGGFLFDTGAHLLNTVADLAGEPVIEVAAWLDNRGRAVDILGAVMARLASGVLITLSGCGDTIESCASDVRVFCTNGILRTGVWGERLEVQRAGDADLTPVEVPASHGAWEQFMHVCRGEIENPSPPEVGLRMAILWDMIRASAQQGGAPVTQHDAEQLVMREGAVAKI